jgi:hypothetical protein
MTAAIGLAALAGAAAGFIPSLSASRTRIVTALQEID